ncbi:transposase [Streptomyces sp. NPDC058008]|uniref:transposase n=1 Tax=Streptomyces sp. NPDC058008 TaxID=3346303 RepID=UPI0036E77BA6
MRKGRIYGTVLVNVETGRPVDLLPDREAATVAAWLAECPEVEVVCRDRAPFFTEGASTGAPTAVQVADRFHLWRNLGEAAKQCVSRHRTCLRAPFTVPNSDSVTASPALEAGTSPWPTGHRFADRTREKHAIVHEMLREGHSRRAVARQLRKTSSKASGRIAGRSSKTSSRTCTSDGPKAARTPGLSGRRSRATDTPVGTGLSVLTFVPSGTACRMVGRRRPGQFPGGS